jgi:hypothetical protein
MKKILYMMLAAVMTITACQTKTKVVPVDTVAAKVAVATVLDKYNSAFKAKDANALITLLSENQELQNKPFKKFIDSPIIPLDSIIKIEHNDTLKIKRK